MRILTSSLKDEDFGLNSSTDDDNEIRTHGLSDSKISNYTK